MENKFKVYYDEHSYYTIDKISSILKSFGFNIKCTNKYDTYRGYEIDKINGELEYSWVDILEGDYDTYPKEGYSVLVSDGIHYDVAYYIMSGDYKWLKSNILEDDANLFTSFVPTKWKYLTK